MAVLSANPHLSTQHEQRSHGPGDEEQAEDNLDDAFLYDVVTRFNEALVGNIDSIDTAVTAVLAGNVTIAVFAIDKIRELHPTEEC